MMNSRSPIYLIMIIAVAILSGCSQSESEKEKAAQQLVDRMVVAANKIDTQEYKLMLADDVKISIKSEENGQQRVISPSKNQYLNIMAQARNSIQEYNLSVSDTKIRVEGEKAHVSTRVNESMKIEGQMRNSKSREELTLEFRDGKPVVTEYVVYMDQ